MNYWGGVLPLLYIVQRGGRVTDQQRETDRERQTERQTERQRESKTHREFRGSRPATPQVHQGGGRQAVTVTIYANFMFSDFQAPHVDIRPSSSCAGHSRRGLGGPCRLGGGGFLLTTQHDMFPLHQTSGSTPRPQTYGTDNTTTEPLRALSSAFRTK